MDRGGVQPGPLELDMFKNALIGVLTVLLLVVSARYVAESPPVPWKPVLETTGFEFLEDRVARLDAELAELTRALGGAADPEVSAPLARLRHEVAHLRDYYLPLTQVRQLTYDADRLVYLGDAVAARRNLTAAKDLVAHLGQSAEPKLQALGDELVALADRALLHIDQGPTAAEEPLRTLGHRVNLLLLKGQLELGE